MTGISEKVAHVRAAKADDPRHTCHWPGCTTVVKPAMWGCSRHWFSLPKRMRDLIWLTYRPGQEVSKTPSAEYLDAVQKVEAWIKGKTK